MSRKVVCEKLSADPVAGLTAKEAQDRLKKFGFNRLRAAEQVSTFSIFIHQLKSLIVYLLIAAAILSLVLGEIPDTIAIAVVLAVNTAIGFYMELRAVRSMEALSRLGVTNTVVLRGGTPREIPADDIVPGDIVVLEGGDVVTADLRIIRSSRLQADESMLTGESMPIEKKTEEIQPDAPLPERVNMLYKGTSVTRGNGAGVVVATGMRTELGKISELVSKAEKEMTPLEKRLEDIGKVLFWVTLGIAVSIVLIGVVFGGKEILYMLETGIALAVATIPEGLPIVATMALARGMWRMAKRNALVNRLSAVETLGATSVIFTDKTGTLTENKMTVKALELPEGDYGVLGDALTIRGSIVRRGEPEAGDAISDTLRVAIETAVLCTTARVSLTADPAENSEAEVHRYVGDPMEVALLVLGLKAGISSESLLELHPEVRQEAFDADVKMMATYHDLGEDEDKRYRYFTAVKGAPEEVLASSISVLTPDGSKALTESERMRWIERSYRMAENGYRIIAVAGKNVADYRHGVPYESLEFYGLIGLLDPPRKDALPAVEKCRRAGIEVVMVTGDLPVTALAIAKSVGIADESGTGAILGRDIARADKQEVAGLMRFDEARVFARVTPKQKLDLVAMRQKSGKVVAMTGDGVNDAPALKKADIGIAMGLRGTQVAREAADMILNDDNFATIVMAVEQGRVIFSNIRKFVLFLLACNLAEVFVIGIASAVNYPLPITPLQILYINLVTDVFPALALAACEGDKSVMLRPPRDANEPIITREGWYFIAGNGVIKTIVTLSAFFYVHDVWAQGEAMAVTCAFLVLAFDQTFFTLLMRDKGSPLLVNEITRNPWVWGSVAFCVALLLVAVYVPVLAEVMKVVNPGFAGWVLILSLAVSANLVALVFKPTSRVA